MRLFAALLRFELLLQWRTLRFRVGVAAYLVLAAAGPIYTYFIRTWDETLLGTASYVAPLLATQPFLSAALAAVVAGNRSNRISRDRLWHALAPSAVSSARYLLLRYLSLAVILLVLVSIPLAVALGIAAAAGTGPGPLFDLLGAWALRVPVLTLWATGVWLGLVTIFRGELAALGVSYVVVTLMLSVANQVLLPWKWHFGGLGPWLGFENAANWVTISTWRWSNSWARDQLPMPLATESPFDFHVALEYWWGRGLLAFGLGALVLGAAVAFVGRTRPNRKPKALEGHPLRTFLMAWAKFRERQAADAALGWSERLVVLLGVLAFVLSITLVVGRQSFYRETMEARYKAEKQGHFSPTSTDLAVQTCQVEGSLSASGQADLRASCRFRHEGKKPLQHLAFNLNPGFEVSLAEPERFRLERSWDRLRVEALEAIAPGEEVEVALLLTGVPRELSLTLRSWSGLGFVQNFEGWRDARFSQELSDLSRSQSRPKISRRRIELAAPDLFPLPRYSPWTLVRNTDAWVVPAEIVPLAAPVGLDLTIPADWLLVDTCGNRSEGARFKGSCSGPLAQLRVRGGRLEEISMPGENLIAVLPWHREHARRQLGVLSEAAELSGLAWPGMKTLEGVVAIEWPPPFHPDLTQGMSSAEVELSFLEGKMLLVDEKALLVNRPLPAEELAAEILVQQLLRRRPLAAQQHYLFRQIFKSLMIARMGRGPKSGAAVHVNSLGKLALQRSLLGANENPYYRLTWSMRLPAVLHALERRVSSHSLQKGIEAFLEEETDEEGKVRQMLAAIEEASGVSLQQMYDDYFLGAALPALRLAEVSYRPQGDGFLISGKVVNEGTGEGHCPIEVGSALGTREILLRVVSDGESPFSIEIPGRPHTVALDPNQYCHRWRHGTWAALERVSLTEG